MLKGGRGFSEWLPTVQHSSSSAERNEKLMGLIKEKQKDIILLLKDQFFFLIRMMINTLRIWFLNAPVWVMHCFPAVFPLRKAPKTDGDSAPSSPHSVAQNDGCCVPTRWHCPLPSPKSALVFHGRVDYTLWNLWGFLQGRYKLKKNQYFYFFLFSELAFKPGEGDTVQVRLRGEMWAGDTAPSSILVMSLAHILYSLQDNFSSYFLCVLLVYHLQETPSAPYFVYTTGSQGCCSYFGPLLYFS